MVLSWLPLLRQSEERLQEAVSQGPRVKVVTREIVQLHRREAQGVQVSRRANCANTLRCVGWAEASRWAVFFNPVNSALCPVFRGPIVIHESAIVVAYVQGHGAQDLVPQNGRRALVPVWLARGAVDQVLCAYWAADDCGLESASL